MTSPILEETPRTVEPAPELDDPADATDVPKSIPTPATEWAPRGKIIDDSARGTIFWEAELSDAELEDDVPNRRRSDMSMAPSRKAGASRSKLNGCLRTACHSTAHAACATRGMRTAKSRLRVTAPS
jgi:hypothetical protein